MSAAIAHQSPEFVTRPGELDDVRFVTSSWVNAVSRPRSDWARAGISQAQLLSAYRDVIMAWVEGHVTRHVTVIELRDVPGEIVGWMAREGSRLHFVYVKGSFRRHGLARALIATAPYLSASSCSTEDWRALSRALGLALKFDPFPFLKGDPSP